MPRLLVGDAKRLGFVLEPVAARVLVERMGANPVRLRNELERLALWAGEGGKVTAADLDAMVSDTSEAAVWALSDALLERDPAKAASLAERLISQGENVTGLIYGLASRLRKACAAAAQIEQGVPPKQVESSLGMHPYAARQLVARLGKTSARGPARGDDRPRRPGGLVPRRGGLRRRAGADAGAQASRGRCRRELLRAAVLAASLAALDFLRAPVFLCSAPFCTALSTLETRAVCSAAILLASPASTAASRRRK